MTKNFTHDKKRLLHGWDAVYDLEEFILAYHLAPLAARDIFAKVGPRRLDLAHATDAQSTATGDGRRATKRNARSAKTTSRCLSEVRCAGATTRAGCFIDGD
ncbi:hypothetical protein [Ensifer sp. OTU672]|uniref:hypothetical protein n=1 Tax=Ensifer sp. OTU672 TaxID=3043861 RepID=UPI00313C5A5B